MRGEGIKGSSSKGSSWEEKNGGKDGKVDRNADGNADGEEVCKFSKLASLAS